MLTTQIIMHPNGQTVIQRSSSGTGTRTSYTSSSNRFSQQQQQMMDPQQAFAEQIFRLMQTQGRMNNRSRDVFQALLTQINQPRQNPVQEDILESLPEMTIDDINKLPQEKQDCVICMCKYEKGEKAIIVPCTHIFHTTCIKDWFKTQNSCPICKFKLDGNIMNGEGEEDH
jgi:hypothetical protein